MLACTTISAIALHSWRGLVHFSFAGATSWTRNAARRTLIALGVVGEVGVPVFFATGRVVTSVGLAVEPLLNSIEGCFVLIHDVLPSEKI